MNKSVKALIIFIFIISTCSIELASQAEKKQSQGSLNAPSRKTAEAIPLTSMDNIIKEIKKIKVVPKKSFILCPFTDNNNQITTDSLTLYFPTLTKIAWTPEKVLNVPFTSYVYIVADQYGLFKLPKKFSEEDIKSFSKALGCNNYSGAKIDKINSTFKVKMKIYLEGATPIERDFDLPEKDAIKIPSMVSKIIFEVIEGKTITPKNIDYIEKLPAKDYTTLKKSAEAFIGIYAIPCKINIQTIKNIIDKSPDIEWFIPVYINNIGNTNIKEAVNLSAIALTDFKENPRFRILYAGMLNNAGETDSAIYEIQKYLKYDTATAKAYEILASAIQKKGKYTDAEPFYQKMIQSDPESSFFNNTMGSFKIDLAWEYRGSDLASTVSKDGWNNFYKELREAKKYLLKSIQNNPYIADSYSKLITVGMGLGDSYSEVYSYFKKARDLEPDYYDIYYRMQNYLMPKWHGSLAHLRYFWDEIYAYKDITNPDIYTLPPYAHYDIARINAYNTTTERVDFEKIREYFAYEVVWADVKKAYEYYFKMREDPELRACYGYLAGLAKKWDVSFEQFELSKMNFKGIYFIPKENLLRQYVFTAREKNRFDRIEAIAKVGLAYNHCPECNKYFQEYLEWALKKQHKK